MTTAPRLTASAGSAAPVAGEVGRAAAVTAVVVTLVTLVAALSTGAPAAAGAAVGGVVVLLFFSFGALVVNAVAAVSPAASLLVALLTYTLQVLALAVALLALSRSGLLEETVDRRWLGGSVIAATLTWSAAHIKAQTRSRIAVYDLSTPVSAPASPAPSGRSEASAR